MEPIKQLLKDFQNFALGGKIFDLAIGLALGAAFLALLQAVVDSLITPIIGTVLGNTSFAALTFDINHSTFFYGAAIQAVIEFLVLAFAILMIVKLVQRLTGKELAGAQGNRECDHCRSFIPVDASVCMFCTRDIEPVVLG